MERRRLPGSIDYASIDGLRSEARLALERFRPERFAASIDAFHREIAASARG